MKVVARYVHKNVGHEVSHKFFVDYCRVKLLKYFEMFLVFILFIPEILEMCGND